MMDRRAFLGASALLAVPRTVRAQSPGKTYRLGVLGTSRSGDRTTLWAAFLQRLRELGYVERENLIIERRSVSEGQADQLRALAVELVRLKVDVIVATGTLTPHAAKSATTTIPVVITNHGDPVGSGLVVSLARPGGNVTGLSLLGPDVVPKQLELLKTAVPRITGIVVLWNPDNQAHNRMLKEAGAAARALGLQLRRLAAAGTDGFDRVFATLAHSPADALLVFGDPIFWRERAGIVALATKYGLPGVFPQHEYVEAGGLMGYGASLVDSFRRAATYVDKILKGARAGDLPIEQPTKFELGINLKTAKALGVTIPPSLLQRADHVIE